jgi:hypothetical protein
MKKTLTAMTLLAGAVSVYSQGSVAMSDYYPIGGLNTATVEIFVPQNQTLGTSVTVGALSGHEIMGNTANTYLAAPGTTVYATPTGLGTGYDVGLLGAAGNVVSSGYSALSLAAGSVVSSWYNTKAGNTGVWNTANTATVAGVGANGLATIALAAWQNTGLQGAAVTLAQAQADGYAWGVSDIVTATLTVGAGTPVNLPTTLTSFSLVPGATPEPSTIALGVIGASAFLFRRRK